MSLEVLKLSFTFLWSENVWNGYPTVMAYVFRSCSTQKKVATGTRLNDEYWKNLKAYDGRQRR